LSNGFRTATRVIRICSSQEMLVSRPRLAYHAFYLPEFRPATQDPAMLCRLYTAICLFLAAGRLTAQGFSPEEALRRLKIPDGFQVKLVAAEPLVRQPVTFTFDDRGRIWVIQYLQYPTPAGLKPIKVDQYLRTTYDRVPEPPPHGPRGADRITILEDPDETGC